MSSGFSTPEEAEDAFYQAFEQLDPPLMQQVWGDDPEAVCVHPGGDLLSGTRAVAQSWSEIFGAAERPTVVHHTLRTTVDGDLAVHLVEERIRPAGSGNPEPSRVLATNVYRRGRGGWHMLAHHASLPLVGARRQERGRLH